MTGEWNSPARQTFDDGLAAHLATVFPLAQQEWLEHHRRLVLAFPDGCTCTIYEPNFYFCLGTLWTAEQLYARAAEVVLASHRTLARGGVI